MKDQLKLLAKIQAKDLVLSELTRSLEKGPERIKERETDIEKLENELVSEKNRMDDTKKTLRQFEMDVESGTEQIKKSKAKLVDIKNNKEYQAVLKEIEKLESSRAQKEDNILTCMEEMDNLKIELREKEQEAAKIRKEVEIEIETIRDELQKERVNLENEKKVRDEFAQKIDPEILRKYETLKSVRGGVAVAQVLNATCSGCNMSIPPQMYNELQKRDTLEFCPNCDRIIYWNGTEETNGE